MDDKSLHSTTAGALRIRKVMATGEAGWRGRCSRGDTWMENVVSIPHDF